VWRCVDCVDWTVQCKSCIAKRHSSAPFHSIQRWDGEKGFFARSDTVLQLFHSRLVPATMCSPHTAYTFRLMEHWHLDVLQSKKPVYDYWMALTRRTRPDTAQDLVRVRMVVRYMSANHRQSGYENFMRAGRWWRDLMSILESGQGQNIDHYLPENRYAGSTAIVCVACPEPGFNMEDDWKEQKQ
ncbi:hypothetical protein AURDEDRAFT_39544, partial [Auricularia subglabra TFB-10046 SS5]